MIHRLTPYVRRPHPFLVMALVLLVALGLRLHGVNWDQGYGFHPDERDIYMRSGCMYDVLTENQGYRQCYEPWGYLAQYPETPTGVPGLGTFLDPERSPLNPHWFPLGTVLLYVLVFLRSIVEVFTDISALDMRYVARPLSALADVGSVFFVFLLGRRMYGERVGLLAAGLTALAVIHVQHSHFYRPETFSVLFTLASFWAVLRMVERRRLSDSAVLGLCLGLALAPKVNILPLLLPLGLAYLYRLHDTLDGQWSRTTYRAIAGVVGHAALAGGVAAAVFVISSPYSLLDYRAFLDGIQTQVDMASNAGSLPFTIQYIDTPIFTYQIQQLSIWGLGLPLGIVAWLAVPATALLAIGDPHNRRADILVLAWIVPTFLFLQTFEVHFLRYVFPLSPFLLILASRTFFWLVDYFRDCRKGPAPSPGPNYAVLILRRWAPGLKWVVVGGMVVVVAATAFYTIAFQRIYADQHPAITASDWIKENVPPGTAIVSDNHWDEYLPDLYSYSVWQYPVYDMPDSPTKMHTLAQRLAQSDYLVFYSNRPYSSVSRAPDRYPYSYSYYRQLFSGKLGYELEGKFVSHPVLLGVTFRDNPFQRAGIPEPVDSAGDDQSWLTLDLGYADDNVVGYDHPQVLIFRNSQGLSEEEIRLRLTSLPENLRDGEPVGLLMSTEQKAAQRSSGTWSEMFDRNSWTNRVPVLAWLLLIEIISLATLPLAMFLFRPLPDRGVVLARILGLLLVSYVTWMLVSAGLIDFSANAFLLGILIVACLSFLVVTLRGSEIREFLTKHWRLLVKGEVVFLVAFLAFVVVRMANPDLWDAWRGGEKPMEFAYLNAVIRSTVLPPFDPWYAGGYLNYYYWGYFGLAGMIRVTGILPEVAFNLAVPLFFALTFTGAYSLVYNFAEGTRRFRASRAGTAGPVDSRLRGNDGGWGANDGGWGANDDGVAVDQETPPRRILSVPWTPTAAGLVAGLFTVVIGNLDGIAQVARSLWVRFAEGGNAPPFDFWRSSRMTPNMENPDPSPLAFWVPDKIPGQPDVSWHITEFPFFTFLFADLHPHMMVIPLTMLVIGLGLAVAVGLKRYGMGWTIFPVLALSVALGALWVTNSWDYPSYLLLTMAVLGLGVWLVECSLRTKIVLWVVLGLSVSFLSIISFLPFHQYYEAFNTGLEASKWRTPISSYLWIHGLFLFVVVTFLAVHIRGAVTVNLGVTRSGGFSPLEAVRIPVVAGIAITWPRVVLLLGFVLAAFLAAAGYWTAAALTALLAVTSVVGVRLAASEEHRSPFVLMPLLLLGMALAISIGVDIVRIEGDIGRMNTLFKYYLEVWILLALASAYMLWHLADQRHFQVRPEWTKVTWAGALLALIGCSLIYTVMGTQARLAYRFDTSIQMTLDGTAYMEKAVYTREGGALELKWDLEAVRWLQDNVRGSPVVLEAHSRQYDWSGRIASYTGLPTILGWPWHQTQQRWEYQHTIGDRAADVRRMYETTNVAELETMLQRYNVEYIVVGELERLYYGEAGIAKFESMADEGVIKPVFSNQGITIYRTDRQR